MERFQTDFDAFQRALSEWYKAKYQRAKTEARYCGFVSLALSLAGKLIVVGSDLGPVEKGVLTFASDRLVARIPEKVNGYAAKLMVGVYDVGTKKVDADRSYSIELMQTNAELVKDEIVALLQGIDAPIEASLPSAASQVADQGSK